MLQFVHPEWLALLALLPLLAIWRLVVSRRSGGLKYSDISALTQVRPSRWLILRHTGFWLRLLALSVMVAALARPQLGWTDQKITSEGIDMMLALDVSSSMQAIDLGEQERIEVARDVAGRFVSDRPNDRMGLVVFSGQGFTQCPLTLDHRILLNLLSSVSITMDGQLEDGTAIGMALAIATNRLRHSTAKSRVVILVTDGANNAGLVDPVTAARAAEALDIKVYAIGVGKRGRAPIRVKHPLLGEQIRWLEDSIDEGVLMKVADITGGRFYRATSQDALVNIYEQINALETSEIETQEISRHEELTFRFSLLPIALGVLLLGFVADNTIFRSVP